MDTSMAQEQEDSGALGVWMEARYEVGAEVPRV